MAEYCRHAGCRLEALIELARIAAALPAKGSLESEAATVLRCEVPCRVARREAAEHAQSLRLQGRQ